MQDLLGGISQLEGSRCDQYGQASANCLLSSLGLERTEDLHEVRRQREVVGWVRAAQERETITLTLLAYWLGTPGLSPVSH